MHHPDARKITKQTEPAPISPLDSLINTPSLNREQWEKEQYSCLYNFFFPLVQEKRLPYEKVAKRTKLKEQRMEEVFTTRLNPTRNNSLLFGHRIGYCHICNARMNLASSMKEPACLKCLQAIQKACMEIEEEFALLEPLNPTEPDQHQPIAETLPVSANLLSESLPENQTSVENILPALAPASRSYEAVLAELNLYKAYFGPLPMEIAAQLTQTQSLSLSNPAEDLHTATSAVQPQAQEPPPILLNDTEQILAMLTMEDRQINVEPQDFVGAESNLPSSGQVTIRHFGFQRSKAQKR